MESVLCCRCNGIILSGKAGVRSWKLNKTPGPRPPPKREPGVVDAYDEFDHWWDYGWDFPKLNKWFSERVHMQVPVGIVCDDNETKFMVKMIPRYIHGLVDDEKLDSVEIHKSDTTLREVKQMILGILRGIPGTKIFERIPAEFDTVEFSQKESEFVLGESRILYEVDAYIWKKSGKFSLKIGIFVYAENPPDGEWHYVLYMADQTSNVV